MINELVKKLRKAADALEELQESNPSSNREAARLIRLKVGQNLATNKDENVFVDGYNDLELERLIKRKKELFDEMGQGKSHITLDMNRKIPSLKKFKRKWTSKKKHWTQTPKGRKKMSTQIKKMWAKKRANKGQK